MPCKSVKKWRSKDATQTTEVVVKTGPHSQHPLTRNNERNRLLCPHKDHNFQEARPSVIIAWIWLGLLWEYQVEMQPHSDFPAGQRAGSSSSCSSSSHPQRWKATMWLQTLHHSTQTRLCTACFHGNSYVAVAGAKMIRSEMTASCGVVKPRPQPRLCSLVGDIAANLEPPSEVWDKKHWAGSSCSTSLSNFLIFLSSSIIVFCPPLILVR